MKPDTVPPKQSVGQEPLAARAPLALSLPSPPQPSEPRPFPLVATIAPIAASAVLWALTRSPYVLVFALLGPLVALASVGDGALQARRRRLKERRRFAADVAAAHSAIAREHDAERSELAAAHRDVRALLAVARRDPERWRTSLANEVPVVVGTGALLSKLDPGPEHRGGDRDAFVRELEALRARAAVLRDAPVVVDARLGIGVCGSPAVSRAVARGIVLQVANLLSPAAHELVVAKGFERDAIAGLPHPLVRSGAAGSVVFRGRVRTAGSDTGADSVTVAVASSAEELPHDCRVVLMVTGASSARLLPAPAGVVDDIVSPEFVSREQARACAGMLCSAADAAGLSESTRALPASLAFASLYPSGAQAGAAAHDRSSLACTPAVGESGPVRIDLVRDGPHAVIGGTTGSGKSELLLAWVLAMAARHSPSVVNFLLVDFKGGSSFGAVQHLPHSVGLITDLDERSASRALSSLRAELRHRERSLADAGVRSIEQLPAEHPLARLVIVVDEFAAMVQDFPELHELFADIAARGRSLGVHLILCTQRPAGVVRDAILANCTLRVSLRVISAADSTAVIGSAAAAELPRAPLGRALLSVSGEAAQTVQVALATEVDSARVAERWTGWHPAPRRPWCDPLPSTIALEDLPAEASDAEGGIAFGLIDLPQEQRVGVARYSPERDGSLVVIGGHRSGKSGMLTVLSAASPGSVRVPRDQEGAWDALTSQLAAVRGGVARAKLLLIDDLDALLGGFPEDYAHALSEVVIALLREGGRAGVHLVITARRLTQGMQSIAALCDSRLVLRLPDRQEYVLAGGDSGDFDPRLQAGGGHWRGDLVQLALVEETAGAGEKAPRSNAVDWGSWPGLLVVAAHPAELLRRLGTGAGDNPASDIPGLPGWELSRVEARSVADPALAVSSPGRPRMLVADPETWQSQWSLLGALRTTLPILFDGCGTADVRALSRVRALPPPITHGSSAVWLLTPDGTIERALPPWAVD